MARGASLLLALFLCSLALRPQIVGIGPLLPRIRPDLGVSHALAGLLGTIPVLCMGLFAPPAAYLRRLLGSRQAIAACLGLIAAAGLGRALVPGAAGVLALTLPIGIGIGFAGALLPVAVKERFPGRPASATGVYATGINLGAALASLTAAPIAQGAGGWRTSFLVFSAATVPIASAWLLLSGRGGNAGPRPPGRPPRLPLRSPVAWWLVVVFGLQGICYYGINAWLASAYVERGWSESSAGALLFLFNFATIPGSLLVSSAADRLGSRRLQLLAGGAAYLAGLLGLLLAPGGAWGFALLVGIANGMLFALNLTLPLDVADDPGEVGAVAGLMLGAGYCIAALAPFALGAVRDSSGSFTATLWVIVGVASLLLLAFLPLTQGRLERRRLGDLPPLRS